MTHFTNKDIDLQNEMNHHVATQTHCTNRWLVLLLVCLGFSWIRSNKNKSLFFGEQQETMLDSETVTAFSKCGNNPTNEKKSEAGGVSASCQSLTV